MIAPVAAVSNAEQKGLLLVLPETSLVERFRQAFQALPLRARLIGERDFFEDARNLADSVDVLVISLSEGNLYAYRPLLEADQPALLIVADASLLTKEALRPRANWDFLRLPLDAAECRLRVRRLLWPDQATLGERFISGGLVLDAADYSARIGSERLALTLLEWRLLAFLLEHKGRACSRSQLLRQVWRQDYFGDMRTVDVHVRRLRAKLGRYAGQLVTVRGVGYLWRD